MMETTDKTQYESNLSKGHTQIPNTIFNVLPLLSLSKRERKIIDLIIRLTYGCLNKEWAQFNLADLNIVGIGKTHAAGVMNKLLESNLVLKNGKRKQYKLNEDFLATVVTKKVTFQLDKLGVLVGKQLRGNSYQNGNPEVTEVVTQELPKEALSGNQNSNSKGLPDREHLAFKSNGFSTPKDIVKDIKKSVKDNGDGKSKYKTYPHFVDPYSFEPTTSGEAAALDAWEKLEPTNPNSFSPTYLRAYGLGVPDYLFYQFVSEIKQDLSIREPGAVFRTKVGEFFRKNPEL